MACISVLFKLKLLSKKVSKNNIGIEKESRFAKFCGAPKKAGLLKIKPNDVGSNIRLIVLLLTFPTNTKPDVKNIISCKIDMIAEIPRVQTVSYTHLTLPTICSV